MAEPGAQRRGSVSDQGHPGAARQRADPGTAAVTDFADLKAQIADYANRQDWSQALVTGFIRQAEEKLNSDLKVDRMIKTSQSASELRLCCVA